jgi:hypothetical protein
MAENRWGTVAEEEKDNLDIGNLLGAAAAVRDSRGMAENRWGTVAEEGRGSRGTENLLGIVAVGRRDKEIAAQRANWEIYRLSI